MGRTRDSTAAAVAASGSGALTSPSSSSSSSSDFEFTVSLSPSSRRSTAPADELFYKGNLLPLHLSPRISMVRTLLLASSSTSSSSDATTSRDSNGSSSSSSAASDFLLPPDCDSSRPSSATEEDVVAGASKRLPRRPNYFSSLATRFSSVFIHRGSKKAEPSPTTTASATTTTAVDLNKKPTTNATAKEVIKKYVKKVKPLYEKLSSQKQNQPQQCRKKNFSFSIRKTDREITNSANAGSTKVEDLGCNSSRVRTQSFSGNLRYLRSKKCAGSCPSSMRSSPTHSGLLSVGGAGGGGFPDTPAVVRSTSSSMEELQSAIQGAIAHCKSSQRKVPPAADEIRESSRRELV